MELLKKKSPSILKSKETVEEINSASQKRLDARRKENEDHHKYLFGAPKPLLKSKKVSFKTGPVNDSPHFVYQ